MNADEFVARIRSLGPSAAHAAAHELTPEDIAELLRAFECPLREPARRARTDAFEDLVVRYDCSRLAIGRVRFVSAPRPHWAGNVVGLCESELLVLRARGDIAAFEYERFGELLTPCARDGASMLDALACFCGMFWERDAWLARTDEAALRCAELAGGPEYADFYLGLMGFLEYGATA